jgi:hypothetical protein
MAHIRPPFRISIPTYEGVDLMGAAVPVVAKSLRVWTRRLPSSP